MCGVAGRDDTKDGFPWAEERSSRIALRIEAVKVSMDKAGDDEELGGTFAWFPEEGIDAGSAELTGTSAVEFADSAMSKEEFKLLRVVRLSGIKQAQKRENTTQILLLRAR